MEKNAPKSQVNSRKRRKDFLMRLFGTNNAAITMSLKRSGIDINNQQQVFDYIVKRGNVKLKASRRKKISWIAEQSSL